MSIDLLDAAELLAEEPEVPIPDTRDRWYRERQDDAEKRLLAAIAAWLLWIESRAGILAEGELLGFPFWVDAREQLTRRIAGILEAAAWQAARRQALELGEPLPPLLRWRVQVWAAGEAVRQARMIVDETSAAVLDAYRLAVDAGLSPAEAGALARSARAFALNRRLAQAVIARALQSPPAQRLAVAASHGARLEGFRQQTIARTLAALGVAQGVTVAGDSLIAMGRRLYKQWVTAADERVCRAGCAPQHGMVLAYDGLFFTGYGIAWGPPLHPRCRCQLKLLPAEEVERGALRAERGPA